MIDISISDTYATVFQERKYSLNIFSPYLEEFKRIGYRIKQQKFLSKT